MFLHSDSFVRNSVLYKVPIKQAATRGAAMEVADTGPRKNVSKCAKRVTTINQLALENLPLRPKTHLRMMEWFPLRPKTHLRKMEWLDLAMNVSYLMLLTLLNVFNFLHSLFTNMYISNLLQINTNVKNVKCQECQMSRMSNVDQISQFQQNFTILTKVKNYEQILQF